MSGKSVLIIGGGVIGLCVALYARRRGHSVAVVERGAPDHDGCSLGNAGMIVPSHFIPLAAPGMVGMGLRMMTRPDSPFYVRPRLDADLARWGFLFARSATASHVARSAPLLRDLSLASRQSYEELADEWGDNFGLTQRGLLMLCKTQHALDDEAKAARMACELGLPADVLTPAEAAKLDPDITMDIAGAVYFPKDCHLTPQKFVARLTKVLEREGVQFAWKTDVTGWRAKNGKIEAARTTNGELSADEYVLAAGAWSPQTLRALNIRLPMQAGKGYSVTLEKPRQLPQICSILTEARIAVTPMGETLRFGGTMEVTGLDNASAVSEPRVNAIFSAIPRYFPAFAPADFSSLPVWSGLRPCSPDGLPYVGRFERFSNLCAATGHSMMGVSLAPVTGKLLSEILSDEPPSIAIDLLRPERFG